MSFDDDDIEQYDTRLHGLYIGTVVNRDDPDMLGRIKFTIPGLIEPESSWAWPLGTVGGGSKNRGFFAVPEEGAEVGILFNQGDVDEPYYLCGHWGALEAGKETPEEAQKKPPDNRVFATETFRFEFDETKDKRAARIINLKTGDFIELDAERNTVVVSGTTAVVIHAEGMVDISGTTVQIQGRTVTPTPDPI